MPFNLTMPKLSPTMEQGIITKWLKKEGDFVDAGQAILEIATDKATVEHAALDPGYLRKILGAEGEEAGVNAPIALFTETADEPFTLPEKKVEPQKPKEEKPQEAPKPLPPTAPLPTFA